MANANNSSELRAGDRTAKELADEEKARPKRRPGRRAEKLEEEVPPPEGLRDQTLSPEEQAAHDEKVDELGEQLANRKMHGVIIPNEVEAAVKRAEKYWGL